MFQQECRGTWTFSLGSNNNGKYVNCKTFDTTSTYSVTLKDPATAVDGAGNVGFWTVIYDQGFEVQINNKKFFAFSYFEKQGTKVISYCDRTFNGWYHDADGQHWGCYSGKKFAENETKLSIERIPTIDLNKRYVLDYELVEKINAGSNQWTAKVYPEFAKLTLRELQRKAGIPIRVKPLPKAKTVGETHFGDLPMSLDWRNISGVSYVPDVRDQASCGSCYAFGTLAMLESRIRIKSKNQDKTVLSPQEIVSCSNYSQGCDGGFEYLVSKYGEDFGIVPETCFPYTGTNSACSRMCANHEQQKRYFTNYQYVGGYFGACSELGIMEEIYTNGPTVVSFEVYSDFFSYHGGIYSHTKLKSNVNPWEETNHSVLCVGWGVENGIKYWIAKNSWGKSWGEKGYFRIKRGNDECAFESMATRAFLK